MEREREAERQEVTDDVMAAVPTIVELVMRWRANGSNEYEQRFLHVELDDDEQAGIGWEVSLIGERGAVGEGDSLAEAAIACLERFDDDAYHEGQRRRRAVDAVRDWLGMTAAEAERFVDEVERANA